MRSWLVVSLGAALGCSRGDAATGGVKPTVDTLPSGIVRVTSEQPVGWSDPSRGWKVTEALRISGQEGTPSELAQPGEVGVDGQGHIYVSDQKPTVVKVFDTTGSFVRTIGREGSGPGEFKAAFLAVRGGTVVVHDPAQSRTSVFDTSGKFVKSWTSSCCFWSQIYLDAADRIYIPTFIPIDKATGKNPGRAYTRFRVDGTTIDTLFVPPSGKPSKEWRFSTKGKDGKGTMAMAATVPYSPELDETYHPAGGFVIGWSGGYRIARTTTGRDTAMLMTRRWTPERIPDDLRQRQVDEMVKQTKQMVGEDQARSIARLEDVSTTAPAFTSLRVDLDGNVWARRLIGGDSTKISYDVFAPTGGWLGELRLPIRAKDWSGMAFGPGAVYATTEDEDGKPIVVKLRIAR